MVIDDTALALEACLFNFKLTDIVRLFGGFEVERRHDADNVREHGIAKARDAQTFCNDAIGQASDIDGVFAGLEIKGGYATVGSLVDLCLLGTPDPDPGRRQQLGVCGMRGITSILRIESNIE